MKPENIMTVMVGLMCGLMAMGLVALPGCASVAPGQDAVAVRAEQAAVSSMETVDAFLTFEAENRAMIRDEGVTAMANRLRQEIPGAFATYMRLLTAYKQNRTPENKLALEGAVELLEAFRKEAVLWMAKRGAKAAGPGAFELAMLAMAGISHLLKLIGEYRSISGKTEEWTPEQQAEFEAKWQKTMAEAEHWKIPGS